MPHLSKLTRRVRFLSGNGRLTNVYQSFIFQHTTTDILVGNNFTFEKRICLNFDGKNILMHNINKIFVQIGNVYFLGKFKAVSKLYLMKYVTHIRFPSVWCKVV